MAIVEEIFEGEEEQTQKVENLKKEGNSFFGSGDYEKAQEKYEEAIAACSETSSTILHSTLLSNLSAALIKLNKWKEAAEAATKAIELGAPNEKALERRAFAYFNISEKFEDSVEDYKLLKETVPKRASEFDRKLKELDQKINKRNEDMKADMMDKLKTLGNMCLSPFGLSTDSFEMIPNGNGGFSVQMKGASNKNQTTAESPSEEEQ